MLTKMTHGRTFQQHNNFQLSQQQHGFKNQSRPIGIFCDMILPIKNKIDWELVCQQKQTQINKDHICKKSKIFYQDYKVRDKFILNNDAAYKYETPYKGPFLITQCWDNFTVTLQCSATTIRYHIRRIKPHTSNTNFEYINS